MTEVLFYHLEQASLQQVLPGLLEKTLERGWRAEVRTDSQQRVEYLDGFLWTFRDESFLPHAASGEGADQPIWISCEIEAPNNPHVLFVVDGANLPVDAVESFERCVTIFDGSDENALNDVRKFWKDAASNGHDVTYWRQSSNGRWEKQA